MSFTPIQSIIGGSILGLSVFWNAYLNGRVTGVSGFLTKTLTGETRSLSFLLGLILGGIVFPDIFPSTFSSSTLDLLSTPRLVLAAFLVGFGTTLGQGCTSGHGLCGLSRFSKRSILAVIIFMITAMLSATISSTASIFKHDHDNNSKFSFPPTEYNLPSHSMLSKMKSLFAFTLFIPAILAVICKLLCKNDENHTKTYSIVHALISSVLGFCFAAGLAISEMVNPAKTIGFLDLDMTSWDPSLLFVFVGALPISIPMFQLLMKGQKPILANRHFLPTSTDLTSRLAIGSAIFGIGWGLVGVCPGPAFVYLGAFPLSKHALLYCSVLALGNIVAKRVVE